MKVDVYFNLHKRVFSVRDCSTGRVVAHAAAVGLRDVTFVVQKAGREKVLREKRKNVHAFVRGTVDAEVGSMFLATSERVSYNPYRCGSFVVPNAYDAAFDTDMPVKGAAAAFCDLGPDRKPTVYAWQVVPV